MHLSLLDAYYHTIHDYPGGAESLAPRLSPKKTATQLCHEARPPEGNAAKAGLITSAQLVALTGDKRIVHSFCAHAGGMFLPLPANLVELERGKLLPALGMLAKEFGDVIAKVSEAYADQNISDNDLRGVEKEATELMAALHHTLQVLSDQHQADKK